ncbi:MAG: ABC transporter permease, partial [Acidobacteria bacterium]|nr:ABC transporter permease [Acidobacteriota bacterium]
MSAIRQWWRRLRQTLTGGSGDDALSEEIESHLAALTDDFIANGMSPHDARLAARRAFGGVDQVREAYRDQERLPPVDAVLQDIRFGVRLLGRDRGFTLVVITVLGLGLGINNLYFTLTYAATMRGLPLAEAARIVHVSTSDERTPDRPIAWPDFVDLSTTQRSFSGLAAFVNQPATLGDEGRAPDRFDGAYVTANAFDLLRIDPLLGRGFITDDDRVGAPAVVLLGERAWRLRYTSDPQVVGREVIVNGSPATVVGIVSERSGFPSTAAVWLPLGQMPGLTASPRDAYRLSVLGRLKDDVAVEHARAKVQSIVDDLTATSGREQMRAKVVPIDERLFQRVEGPWLAFLLAAGLVVVISSANVANLMIGRSMRRAHELAIRASLGAGRGRLVAQLLVESAMLAVIAVVVGAAISFAGAALFRSVIPDGTMPYWIDFSMDTRVFAVLCLVAVGTLAVFGVVPALLMSRADANDVLKNGRRTGSAVTGAGRWTSAFLAVELAMAVIFLSQAALVVLSSTPDLPSDRSLDTAEVVAATVTLPAARYQTPDERRAFYVALTERVRQSPGVSSVTIASHLPLSGSMQRNVLVDGMTSDTPPPSQPAVGVVEIGPQYFEALELPLRRGDSFSASTADARASVIVNERFVEVFLTEGDPIGRRIALTAPAAPTAAPEWLTIVGIAPDVKQRPSVRATPVVYTPLLVTAPATAVVLARSSGNAALLAPALRASALDVDPNVALYRMTSLSQSRRDAEWNGRTSEGLALTLTIVSVLLATVGLYAVTAHAVTLRTQEIGIRMALGARSSQVMLTVLRSVRVPLVAGFVLGIAGSMAWHRAF